MGQLDVTTTGFSRPHRFDPSDPTPAVLGPHDVNAAPVIGPGGGLVAIDGAVLAPGARRGALTVDAYSLSDGSVETISGPRSTVTAFAASPDGSRSAAAVTSIDRPAELWRLAPGEPTRLRSLNDDLLAHLEGNGTAAETLQRALLQCLATDHASRRGFAAAPDEAEAELRYRLGLDTDDGYHTWLEANDLDRADARRLATAQAALVWAAEQFDAETRNVVADVLRLRDRYPTVRASIEARAVSR